MPNQTDAKEGSGDIKSNHDPNESVSSEHVLDLSVKSNNKRKNKPMKSSLLDENNLGSTVTSITPKAKPTSTIYVKDNDTETQITTDDEEAKIEHVSNEAEEVEEAEEEEEEVEQSSADITNQDQIISEEFMSNMDEELEEDQQVEDEYSQIQEDEEEEPFENECANSTNVDSVKEDEVLGNAINTNNFLENSNHNLMTFNLNFLAKKAKLAEKDQIAKKQNSAQEQHFQTLLANYEHSQQQAKIKTSTNLVNSIKTKPTTAKSLSASVHQSNNHTVSNSTAATAAVTSVNSKKQMRFQCKFCVYKSHSVSLMQNHIYRHIDTTPYSCYYCGHKSTTKSTIMVHIELCHPNMEVKIKESRVKEEDYYIDLNSSGSSASSSCSTNSSTSSMSCHSAHNKNNKFEIIADKCRMGNNGNNMSNDSNNNNNNSLSDSPSANKVAVKRKQNQSSANESNSNNSNSDLNTSNTNTSGSQALTSSILSFKSPSNMLSNSSIPSSVSNSSPSSSSSSSSSSLCSSPSISPTPVSVPAKQESSTAYSKETKSQAQTANGSGMTDEHVNFVRQQLQQQQAEADQNEDEADKEGNGYSTVFNRPKQYFGSLYEPDKQYSCKLCTYTTNHKPSMEDHVYVHTNKRPYRCGYCNEEIYTRYAATYHNKYKHPGEARNFIKDEQDVSIYYVNRAKKNGSSASFTSTPTSISNNHSNKNDEELADINNKNQLAKSNVSMNTTPAISHHHLQHQQQPNHTESKPASSSTNDTQIKKHKKSHHDSSSSSSNSQSTSSSAESSSNSQIMASGQNQYAAALTQLMLNNALASNGAASQANPLQNPANFLNASGNNPMAGLGTNASGYDFNLALKMYQIQLQSLMTANYLQSMRQAPGQQIAPAVKNASSMPNSNLFSSFLGLNPDQLKQLTGSLLSKSNNSKSDEGGENASGEEGYKNEDMDGDESDDYESGSLKNVKQHKAAGVTENKNSSSNKNSLDCLKKLKNSNEPQQQPQKLIRNK